MVQMSLCSDICTVLVSSVEEVCFFYFFPTLQSSLHMILTSISCIVLDALLDEIPKNTQSLVHATMSMCFILTQSFDDPVCVLEFCCSLKLTLKASA